MNKKEALNEFFKNTEDDTVFGKEFISWLYDRGFVIINREELKKINSMTVLADIHGMNPLVDYEKKYGIKKDKAG